VKDFSTILLTSIDLSSDGFGGRRKFVNMRLSDCGKIDSAVSAEIRKKAFQLI
jgi:hypothetical protein